jgi:acyl transferase domain-containing protein
MDRRSERNYETTYETDYKKTYETTFTGQELILTQHKIRGRSILPAVSYLEMVRSCVEKMTGQSVVEYSHVLWPAPFEVLGTGGALCISLCCTHDRIVFEIVSNKNEQRQIHSQGKVRTAANANARSKHMLLSQDEIKRLQLNSESQSSITHYQRLLESGICYGQLFKAVEELWVGKKYCLTRIDNGHHSTTRWLSPGLLDGALQGVNTLHHVEVDQLLLPFSVETIEILSEVPAKGYAYIKPTENTSGLYTVQVLNDLGEICIVFSGLCFRSYRDEVYESSNQKTNTIVREPDCNAQMSHETKKVQSVQNVLKHQISELLEIAEGELADVEEDVSNYGFDSVTLTELTNRLNDTLGIELMPTAFFEHTTISDLADHIIDRFGENLSPQHTSVVLEDLAATISAPGRYAAEQSTGDKRLASNTHEDEQIAIVGLSCRFPSSSTADEFWHNLKAKKDVVSEVSRSRWDWRSWSCEDFDESIRPCLRWGGFLEGIDQFDAAFFSISPREASLMDPQQRIFLELVWHALEDAGIRPSRLSHTKTGIFVGVASTDYHDLLTRNGIGQDGHRSTGYAHSILANRVSYLLDIHGPSEAIDTACSSSLVALHRACQSIQSGECETAVVGGVNVILNPEISMMFAKAGMLSEDGRCKSFSQNANGYVRGEGGGVVIIKSLSQAIKDGNQIHAIIKGSGVNHGGRATSLTAPNPKAQASLLIDTYRRAGVDPRSLGYLETHGTGTELGDPIEINGLKSAFEELYRVFEPDYGISPDLSAPHCGLGSVKSNIGHLEAAAGMAGLLKVILALKHKTKPAGIHTEKLNRYIDLDQSPFYVVREAQDWEPPSAAAGSINHKRRAGISSFGFGGVNAHVILEEYEKIEIDPASSSVDQIVTLSAKSETALKVYVENLLGFLTQYNDVENSAPTLRDVAYTHQVGREHYRYRACFIASSMSALLDRLQAFGKGEVGIFDGNHGDNQLNESAHVSASVKEANLSSLAALWMSGSDIDWTQLSRGGDAQIISLPNYPYDKSRHWFDADRSKSNSAHSHQPITAPNNRSSIKLTCLEEPHRCTQEKYDSPSREAASEQNINGSSEYREKKMEPAKAVIQKDLEDLLATILYISTDQIDESKTFAELGVDSILGVELIKKINLTYDIAIKSSELFDYPTLPLLTVYVNKLTQSMETANENCAQNVKLVRLNEGGAAGTDAATRVVDTKHSLRQLLAATLQLADTAIDERQTFADLGVDSILGVELIKSVNKQFACELKSADLFDYPTLDTLAEKVTQVVEDTTTLTVSIPSTPECSGEKQAGQRQDREIAVVGLSCRFPGANNKDAYWDLLKEGACAITEIPAQRWAVSDFYSKTLDDNGTSISKWGGFVDHPDYFDPAFFYLSPQEAELMDPQQRIFLQESWKAIEDAGYAASDLSGKKCGVYAGVMNNDYAKLLQQTENSHVYELTGNSNAVLSSRIAYFLNLKGPSLTIDTACSSSLVALHLACSALRQGEVDMALAGGVSLYLDPKTYVLMSKAGMLSPQGRCKTFDKNADGFVPADGVGVMVLKRLSDAELSDDHIYGVIKGTGINQDGKTSGITAPSAISQSELTTNIYKDYHIDPETITYLEAHGTGTALGDPVEVSGLTRTFKQFTDKKQYCGIGSVKTNLGHTSGAAGVAGLIKLLLCFQHKQLVPTINYEQSNPEIDFENTPFYINTQLTPWSVEPGKKRCGAVSAFGFSGTNAHAVVEQYYPAKTERGQNTIEKYAYLFVLSARTPQQLRVYAHNYLTYISNPHQSDLPSLDELIYTLQVGREAMVHRLVFVVSSYDVLLDRLTKYIGNAGASSNDQDMQICSGEGANEVAAAEQVAKKWMGGINVDWSTLYQRDRLPKRVPLPTYPFAEESHWYRFEKSHKNKRTTTLNPIAEVDKPQHDSYLFSLNSARFERIFTGDEDVVKSHLVDNKKILMGGLQIEMALLAVQEISKKKVKSIRNIVWDKMINIDETGKVNIELTKSQEAESDLLFSVWQDDEVKCSSAIMRLVDDNNGVEDLNLESIKGRCNAELKKQDIYQRFRSSGLEYGECFQTLNWVKFSNNESVSNFQFDGVDSGTTDHLLVASIIDGAMQSASCLIPFNSQLTAVPHRIASINILSTLDSSGFAYVERLVDPDSMAQSFNIYISDGVGRVLMTLEGVEFLFTKVPKTINSDPILNSNKSNFNSLDKYNDDTLVRLLSLLESKRAAGYRHPETALQ